MGKATNSPPPLSVSKVPATKKGCCPEAGAGGGADVDGLFLSALVTPCCCHQMGSVVGARPRRPSQAWPRLSLRDPRSTHRTWHSELPSPDEQSWEGVYQASTRGHGFYVSSCDQPRLKKKRENTGAVSLSSVKFIYGIILNPHIILEVSSPLHQAPETAFA